jgi:hypothetical protein
MAATSNAKSLKFIKASGLDQNWKGEIGYADDIVNARIDPDGLGWLFDRGIEPWWDPKLTMTVIGTNTQITQYLGSTIDSCYVWTKQNTEQTYYLVEQAGNLYYFWGNKGSKTGDYYWDDLVVLATGRHIPKANEAGTQYIPYGNRLLIINGYDQPIWFYGRQATRDFGFTIPTPAPETLDIQTSYLSGSNLDNAIASPTFTSTSNEGLGQEDKRNFYTHKVTFVMDTGAESPLSSSSILSWKDDGSATEGQKFGAFLKDFPIGPNGCCARRLYRTKNQKTANTTGAADAVYYLVKQVNENVSNTVVDVVPDGNLVNQADVDSTLISSAYQYGTTWDSRIWLAGGTPHPTRIIYSLLGIPEQFGIFNYFELGSSVGGAITGLYPYYNNLLVFRQRSIDLIRLSNGQLVVSSLSPEIGTEATNTIKLVPGLGVFFLNNDGIYAITGGTEGGSTVNIQKVSSGLSRELERISKSSIARATAVYSSKEKEYWCHYPVDGQKYNSRGAVFHTANRQWSLRHSLTSDNTLFRFSSMAVDPAGNIILGPSPVWSSDAYEEESYALLPGVLQVWSGAGYWGKKLTVFSHVDTTVIYTAAENHRPGIVWESNWIDFGDISAQHRVFHVEAEIVSYGNLDLQLYYAKEYDYLFSDAGIQMQARSETVNTTSEDPVFGPTTTTSKKFFTVGTSVLQNARIITLRWDVNTTLVNNFKFKLTNESSSPFHLLNIHIVSNDGQIIPLNQRANGTGR